MVTTVTIIAIVITTVATNVPTVTTITIITTVTTVATINALSGLSRLFTLGTAFLADFSRRGSTMGIGGRGESRDGSDVRVGLQKLCGRQQRHVGKGDTSRAWRECYTPRVQEGTIAAHLQQPRRYRGCWGRWQYGPLTTPECSKMDTRA
jgi:uncharacterized membrane protein YdfJ with MMPL/SSD domain